MQAKQISLLHILNRQGFKASYRRNNKGTIYHWFISPFRQTETKASFSYNSQLNTFYDYGNGISGTVVDYICAYYQCEIPKALELLQDLNFSFSQQNIASEIIAKKKEIDDDAYKITAVQPLTHGALLQYLARRKLNPSFYKRYLVQIDYMLNGSARFALAFQNDSKGYELSYEYWSRQKQGYTRIKQCLIKKDITHIENGRSSVVITESWSDFLALLTLYPKMEMRNDFIIMNSVAMLDRVVKKINSVQYATIYAATDNDASGKTVLDQLIQHYGDRVIPLNAFYRDYKDIAGYLERSALK